VNYLEEKLDMVVSANLELNCFADRLRQVENQLSKLNARDSRGRTDAPLQPKNQHSLSERCVGRVTPAD
jgi:hypothetical protein